MPLFTIFGETWHRPKKHAKTWKKGLFQARRIRRSLVRNAQPLRKLLRGRARNLLAQRGRNAVEQLARLADPLVLPLHQPRPPLRGPEVPAVLPRLAAAAGLAQAPPRPPAHVGPQPRLLPVRSPVHAVGDVTQGRRSMNGRVFSSPVAGFSTIHMSGSKCAMISRALSTSASPSRSRARRQRAAVFRADGAGPNHVEVPRERRVVPAPDVAEDGGLKFRHDVQGDDLPARRLEGPAHRLVPQKSSRSLGIFKEQDHRHYDENSHVHRTGLFSYG